MTSFKAHHMHHDFVPKPINCIAYDDVGKKMAVARFDDDECQLEVWSTEAGCWMLEKLLPTIASVEDMLWHGGMLMVAGLVGDLVVYDVTKARVKESVSCNFGPIWCLALSPNKKLIAAGTEEGCVVLFDALKEAVVYKQSVAKQPGRVLSIGWFKDDFIVTGGSDVRVFDTTSGRCVQRVAVGKQLCVWSLVVTRDFTIITGDSSGHTTFWYGEPGQVSHCKRYRSHEADIHAVSLSQEANVVAVAGVDGIVLFKLLASKVKDAASSWVMAGKRTYHSNDVRAVQFIEGRVLVSAGLDCHLVVSEKMKKVFKISACHQRSFVKVAGVSRCLLHEYDRRVELWMADTAFCDEEDTSKFRQQLQPQHVKLAVVNAASRINCSFVSNDGKYIGYSDQKSTCVFRNIISHKDSSTTPSIRVLRMHLPTTLRSTPSSHLTISPRNNVFASVSEGNIITFFGLDDVYEKKIDGVDNDGGKKVVNLQMKVLSTLALPDDISIRSIAFNSTCTHLYVASLKHAIAVVDVAEAVVSSSLPSHHKPPTSICPHPSKPHLLLVSYADGMIAEYRSTRGVLSRRSKVWSRKHQTDLHRLQTRFINRILYDPSRPDWLILQHDYGFSLVDWSQLDEKKEVKVKTQALLKYVPTKALFAVETTARKRNLFLVEKCPMEMIASYRPPIKKHKFGQ